MTYTQNHRIRFGDNNRLGDLTTSTFSVTSTSTTQQTTLDKLSTPERVLAWTPTGYFEITAINKYLYVDEGTGTETITLTEGSYTSPDALASHIETQLNAVLGLTMICDRVGDKFYISGSGSFTLVLSNRTNSIWDDIGYTSHTDITGTSITATVIRLHTYERFSFDFGVGLDVTLISLLPESDTILSLSQNATVRVRASNMDDITTAYFDTSLNINDEGIISFIDQTETPSYRYWWLDLIDKDNSGGQTALNIAYLYIGDHLTFDSRNMSDGFSLTHIIRTTREQSEGGQLFHNIRPSYKRISNTNIRYLTGTDARKLESFLREVDIWKPFIISLDPALLCTPNETDLSMLCVLESEVNMNHIRNDLYSFVMTFREIL